MSSVALSAKRFHHIDLLPGGLMLLCLVAWGLFAAFARHGDESFIQTYRSVAQILLLLSATTWITTRASAY